MAPSGLKWTRLDIECHPSGHPLEAAKLPADQAGAGSRRGTAARPRIAPEANLGRVPPSECSGRSSKRVLVSPLMPRACWLAYSCCAGGSAAERRDPAAEVPRPVRNVKSDGSTGGTIRLGPHDGDGRA